MNLKQMIATIQIYIHHRKGVEVDISPNLPREMPKLLGAYYTALNWLKSNGWKQY